MTDSADAAWLRDRIRAVLDCYYPVCREGHRGRRGLRGTDWRRGVPGVVRPLLGHALATLVAPTGAWYERVDADNEAYPTGDSPAVEPGYHPIGTCYEAIRSLGE